MWFIISLIVLIIIEIVLVIIHATMAIIELKKIKEINNAGVKTKRN